LGGVYGKGSIAIAHVKFIGGD
jgi:hypothetical protein